MSRRIVVAMVVAAAAMVVATEEGGGGVVGMYGEELVSRNSSFCDWNVSMGPICVYNNTDKVVVVPTGLRLSARQMEVEIHHAKVLHVYPTCVSWIQVFNAGLVTTLPASPISMQGSLAFTPEDAPEFPNSGTSSVFGGRDVLGLSGARGARRECRTWLRIYESKVDSVVHGVKDLTLINCEVNTISLTSQRDFMAIHSSIQAIEALDWSGYRGTIQNTTVSRVSGLVANDNLWVIESDIGFVSSGGILFNGADLTITNTTIATIASQGLRITRGAATLTNVTIEKLEARGIDITSSEGYLALRNVTITTAETNAIIVAERERISIQNVTVNGQPLNMSSEFLAFRDDPFEGGADDTVQVGADTENCTVADNVLTCDFANITMPMRIEVSVENVKGYSEVVLKNAQGHHVNVVSLACGQKLSLDKSQGSLDQLANMASWDSECEVSLSARDSTLMSIPCGVVTSINLTNTTVKKLHSGTLKELVLSHGVVHGLHDVTVDGIGATWNNMEFDSITNLTFLTPVNATTINVKTKMHQMNFNHPGQSSIIAQARFSSLRPESVFIQGGNVTLEDVFAVVISEGAVKMDEGTFLEITNFRSILKSFRVISVASKDQVVLKGRNNQMGWLDLLLHVRIHPPPSESGAYVITSGTSAHCNKMSLTMQLCSFADYPEAGVIVNMTRPQPIYRTLVESAKEVTIVSSCSEKLILQNVTKATTVEEDSSCPTWLEARGVAFTNITTGVHDVTLSNCTVDLLAPDRVLRDVDLEDTYVRRVRGVHWRGYTGIFNNTRMDEVEGLLAGSRMIMSNSHVGLFMHDALTVTQDATIENTVIEEVQDGAIELQKGYLNLNGVSIGSLARGAVVVRGGLLILTNVTIDQAEASSIVADANGGVAFRNVSVGGYQVVWRGYLTHPDEVGNHSLILTDQHLNDTQGSATTTPPPPPPPPPPAKPAATTTTTTTTTSTTTTTTTTTTAPTSPPNPKKIVPTGAATDVASAGAAGESVSFVSEEGSWRWAGPSVGFLVGMLACGLIYFVVRVLKPNKGRFSMLPTVSWSVKEDQHNLLADDAAPDVPEPRPESGYQTLPSTEVA